MSEESEQFRLTFRQQNIDQNLAHEQMEYRRRKDAVKLAFELPRVEGDSLKLRLLAAKAINDFLASGEVQ